jgi:hypothetical protein
MLSVKKRFYFVFVIVDPRREDLKVGNRRAKGRREQSRSMFLRIKVRRGSVREDERSRRCAFLPILSTEKKVEQRAEIVQTDVIEFSF